MQCPVCKQDQLIVEFKGVELDVCLEGHGIWFDGEELRQLFEVAGAPRMLHDLEERLTVLPEGGHGPVRTCPRCRAKMRHVEAQGRPAPVVLDRCPRGHGLWFDEGELEQVLASELDEGDAALGRIREFLGSFALPGVGPESADDEETQVGKEEPR